MEGLIQDYIREGVFYREAIAVGLDRDDTITRRRLRQKMGFLSDDLTTQFELTEVVRTQPPFPTDHAQPCVR